MPGRSRRCSAEHELPGTARHDPLAYLQNRSVDWLDHQLAARELLSLEPDKTYLVVEHEYPPARIQDRARLAPILAGSLAFTRAIDEAAAAMFALQHEVLPARRESPYRASAARPTGPEAAKERSLPFVSATSQRSAYDVIVVGSGAGGGQAAYTLCMEGARVLMLEAGRSYSPETETPMFQTPDQAPLGGVGTPQKPFGFYDATVDGGWEVPGEPYVRVTEDQCTSLRLVARAHARRAHQPLGAHLAAQRSLRLQAAHAATAWASTGRSATRTSRLLRQGGAADRRLRQQRGAGEHAQLLARMSAAAAEAAGERSAGEAARRSSSASR